MEKICVKWSDECVQCALIIIKWCKFDFVVKSEKEQEKKKNVKLDIWFHQMNDYYYHYYYGNAALYVGYKVWSELISFKCFQCQKLIENEYEVGTLNKITQYDIYMLNLKFHFAYGRQQAPGTRHQPPHAHIFHFFEIHIFIIIIFFSNFSFLIND